MITIRCGGLQTVTSAPENTRKACPEEGHPEGPELPEDITRLTQQIHRMQQTPEIQDSSTEMPPKKTRRIIKGPDNPTWQAFMYLSFNVNFGEV
jgi:hypothetical protein